MQVNSVFMKIAEQFEYRWHAPIKGCIYQTKIHGGHPVIVISDNAHNQSELNVYVVPLTTKSHPQHRGPRLAEEDGVAEPCYAKIDQIEHMPKTGLGKYQGTLKPETLAMLETYLKTIFFGEPKQRLPRRKK